MESDKMENCIFCKIIKGEIPSFKTYEDDFVLAFLDINPESNGHTLIIPKKHYTDLNDIDSETLNKIFTVGKLLMAKLQDKLNCDGFTFIQNNGAPQEVKHYHLHLRPYYQKKQKIVPPAEMHKTLSD